MDRNSTLGLIALESPQSTWLFDEVRHCFRRATKAPCRGDGSTQWRSYDHLVIDDTAGIFLVFLDATGTRVLRSRGQISQRTRLGSNRAVEVADGGVLTVTEQSSSSRRSRLVVV